MRTLPVPLRRLLWLLGILYVVYLIIGNIFLNSSLASSTANRKPQSFQAQWAWAWTVWPGQVHAHELRMHGHARKWLWTAQGQSVDGRVRLWPLLHREVRFTPIDASSVSIDVQHTTVDHEPPPFRSNAWHLTLDSVRTTSLREVRVGDVLVQGSGTGAVGFTHQLRGGASEIFPSRITMTDARASYGTMALLHDATLDANFAFDTFTHDQPPGWRKVQRAMVHVTAEGATPAIALGASDAGAKGAKSSTLAGHFSADLSLDHGTLAEGGRLQWNVPVTITDADGTQQQRRGQLDLDVQPLALLIHARIPPPPGEHSGTAPHQLEAHLRFGSRHVLPRRSVGEWLRLLSGTVDGRWHFASLNWLSPLTRSKPWLQLQGAGDINGALKIEAGRLLPGTHVELPRVALAATLMDNVFAGSAQAQARVLDGKYGGRLLAGLHVNRFTLAPAAATTEAYLRGRDLQVDVQSSSDLASFREALAARLHFSDAQIPDLRTYNRYLPGKSLQFLQGSGAMSTDVSIDGDGDINRGRMQMSSTAARVALGVSRLSGTLKLDTRLDHARRAGHAYDLKDFTLGLDGVRVEGSAAPPWWGRLTLQQGRLDWDRPMRLRGDATLVMKDVSLLLSLFADRSAFPKWIANVINDGQATAHAAIEVQRGDFVLDHLVASNKRVDLFAHLRIRDGQPTGDLYARWGLLGLGVGLADGKREFHLLHAQRWYEGQPNLIAPSTTSPR